MFGSLFETSVAKSLTSLKELTIENCDGLKHIITHARVKRNQQQKKTQIELPALQNLQLDSIPNSIIPYSSYVRCPSLETLSLLGVGRYVGFFTVNCSANTSEGRHLDYITIKV